MATTRIASRRARWQPDQVARLRKMASTRPVGLIASELGRTESAVRSKAHQEGISIDSSGRAAYGKPALARRAAANGGKAQSRGRGRGDGGTGRARGRGTRH